MSKIKIYFIGTSEFGRPALRALDGSSEFEIEGVITQPDKPSGRDLKLRPAPIKEEAANLGLPVFQPEKIGEFRFPSVPDLIIVISYSQILPKKVLDLPEKGCLNVHGSLLPKYRGASCIQAPILAGDKESGISVIVMDEGLDTGPVIAREKIALAPDETAGSLHDRLSVLAAKILPKSAAAYFAGRVRPVPQDNNLATYVKKVSKESGRINWEESAENIERFVRAMHPWPGAFSFLEGKQTKILKTGKQTVREKTAPGILYEKNGKLYAGCGNGSLEIHLLQLPGKRPISAADLINGYPGFLGKKLD